MGEESYRVGLEELRGKSKVEMRELLVQPLRGVL
jgi:hypothetical protein